MVGSADNSSAKKNIKPDLDKTSAENNIDKKETPKKKQTEEKTENKSIN